jgi:hypothetical protein
MMIQESRWPGMPGIATSWEGALDILHQRAVREVRIWLLVFIIGLVLSGVTAFPLETELHWLLLILNTSTMRPVAVSTQLLPWITKVSEGLSQTKTSYPFLAYGTDWLAFGHLVIATVFLGPYRDPVRNKWIIDFGLIACAGVIPLALIAGHVRGIPFPWRLIDCSFGVFGALPLLRCRSLIEKIEALQRLQ